MANIRLLGPVEVWHDGGVLRLDRRQQRVILGTLALEPNRMVPAESLIDVLWSGEALPRDARAVTQTRVSELKSTLHGFLSDADDIRIVGRASGYLLAAAPEAIDAHRFLALLERVRRAEPGADACGLARQALGLWRGRCSAAAWPAPRTTGCAAAWSRRG